MRASAYKSLRMRLRNFVQKKRPNPRGTTVLPANAIGFFSTPHGRFGIFRPGDEERKAYQIAKAILPANAIGFFSTPDGPFGIFKPGDEEGKSYQVAKAAAIEGHTKEQMSPSYLCDPSEWPTMGFDDEYQGETTPPINEDPKWKRKQQELSTTPRPTTSETETDPEPDHKDEATSSRPEKKRRVRLAD